MMMILRRKGQIQTTGSWVLLMIPINYCFRRSTSQAKLEEIRYGTQEKAID